MGILGDEGPCSFSRELASSCQAARANDVRGIGVMMTLNRNIARDLDTLAQKTRNGRKLNPN